MIPLSLSALLILLFLSFIIGLTVGVMLTRPVIR